MFQLEKIAKSNFEVFAAKHNYKAKWELLSIKRKIQWMQEVIDISAIISEEITAKLSRPVPILGIGAASYERGINDGIRTERLKILDAFSSLKRNLEEQISSLQEHYNEKERQDGLRKHK